MTGLAVALTGSQGLAGSVQVAVMGQFGGAVGVVEAPTSSTAIQLGFSLEVLLVARARVGGLAHVGRTPAWMSLDGLMGLTVVGSIAFAQPKHRRHGDDRDPDRGPARDRAP